MNMNGTDFGEDTYPMVQNNKVLTVSYGTFSCTLEGFEDSFGTMQAIAEYFRDLAADDRYFGAEPPQPDADMLARIAQKEIARQVEARTSTEGIHLRAATGLPAPAAPQPAPAQPEPAAAPAPAAAAPAPIEDVAPVQAETPVQTTAPVQHAAPAQEAEPAAQDIPEEIAEDQAQDLTADANTPVAEDVSEPAPKPAASPESIAAKLRRIRAVVAQTPSDDFTEDQHADQVREEALQDIQNALSADHAIDAEPETTQELDGDDSIDDATDDAIAAALDRIDLAGTSTAAAINAPAEADAFFADSPSLIASEDTASDDTARDDLDDAEDDDLSADDPIAVLDDDSDEDDSLFAQDEAQDDTEDTVAEDSAEPAAETTPERPRRTARIARIKRADLEAAMAAGALEELDDDSQTPEVSEQDTPAPRKRAMLQPDADSSLSDDDEADLMAELAAVEAELLGDDIDLTDVAQHDEEAAEDLDDLDDDSVDLAALDDDDDMQENAEQTHDDTPVAKRPAPLDLGNIAKSIIPGRQPAALDEPAKRGPTSTADSDIARLMAATDAKLEDPETSDQRETYSQLRAVMAAASAERSAGGSLDKEDDAQVYRDDLASVVRPRRPGSRTDSGSDRRPAAQISRPAPLKLVQEQRIDETETPAAAPVRPRRVSAAVLAEEPRNSGSEGGFAAYAQEAGAVELGELLEAAAAYMSFVEGRDHFSRPQLMNKVRGVDGTEFNREDGLRSFGQLLREGKIERADNGRFTASGQIGFQPGNRAAG